MRIALNARILRAPRTGIGNYVSELARELAAFDDLQLDFFSGLNWSDEMPTSAPPGFARLTGLIRQSVPGSYQLRRAVETRRFAAGIARRRIDLYHEPSLWPLHCDRPMVMTIHDLTHVRYPETQPARRIREIERHVGHAVLRARRVLCDSHYIADEVRRHFALPEAKVMVAPLGCAARFFPRDEATVAPVLRTLGLSWRQFVLCVGTLEPRKNLPVVLAAHASLPADFRRRHPLVIVGTRGWHGGQFSRQLQQGVARGDVRLPGYLTDDVLAQVLGAAGLLAFPSRYEGFGLPVLEAMASATPTVLSACASIPEVAGTAGVYCEPDDVSGWAQAMRRLLDDAAHRQGQVDAGLQRAREFSWRACAEQTRRAYAEALAGA